MDGIRGPVLVTGGAGFIGSHLVERLARAGIPTVVLDDLSAGAVPALPPGVAFIRADISDPRTANRIADVGAGLVIHAAGQVSVAASVADPRLDRLINVEGTRHVLEGARRGGAERVVFLSSGGAVYGPTRLAREDDPSRPVSPYGSHKLAAEVLVEASGIPFGIVRFSNVYGPRQRAGVDGAVVAVFTDALLGGHPITIHGDGSQTRDLLHVSDAVSGILAVAAAARSSTWNVSTGVATSVIALLTTMEAISGRRASVRHGPPRAGDIRDSRLSPARIARELGWRASVGLEAGLADLLPRTVAA